MQDYAKFLKAHPVGVLATATNNQPSTRYFQYLWSEDNMAYFCTGRAKRVFVQLSANSLASFCSINPETFETLSIEGKIQFVDDLARKTRVLEENPAIADLYGQASNPEFQLFALNVSLVRSFSFTQGTKELDINVKIL